MTMNRFLFTGIFIILSVSVHAQVKKFQDNGSGAFRLKVLKNDTVFIAEDSAYVYSSGMVEKINVLEKSYLSCLSLRDDDLDRISRLLSSLKSGYEEIEDLLRKSVSLNNEQLDNFHRRITGILDGLQSDIISLQQVEKDLSDARAELENVKKEIRRERRRLWWKKTGSIFVALLAGFGAGMLVAS